MLIHLLLWYFRKLQSQADLRTDRLIQKLDLIALMEKNSDWEACAWIGGKPVAKGQNARTVSFCYCETRAHGTKEVTTSVGSQPLVKTFKSHARNFLLHLIRCCAKFRKSESVQREWQQHPVESDTNCNRHYLNIFLLLLMCSSLLAPFATPPALPPSEVIVILSLPLALTRNFPDRQIVQTGDELVSILSFLTLQTYQKHILSIITHFTAADTRACYTFKHAAQCSGTAQKRVPFSKRWGM